MAPISAPRIGISRNAEPDVLARRARRDVEHLEAVVLEHRDLLGARVVGEADDLLRRHLARVDLHVDARVLRRPARETASWTIAIVNVTPWMRASVAA